MILSLLTVCFLVTTFSVQAQKTTGTPNLNEILNAQISLPITWNDTANIDYTTIDFGGNSSTIGADPANPSNLVLKVIKSSAAETWAGTTLSTTAGFLLPIPFSVGNTSMKARIFAPSAGMQIRLKAEDSNDPTKSVETPTSTTLANGWQVLTFNFVNQAPGTAPINYNYNYNKLSIFFNFGVDGATAGTKTFFLDDVEFGSGPVSGKAKINLPITWDDSSNVDYSTVDFAGDSSELAADPLNPSNIVLKILRLPSSLIYAGTVLGTDFGLLAPIPLTAVNRFLSARVYSPLAGITVRLKIENSNGGVNVETDKLTTVANQWENLTFDFAQNASGTPAINYNNIHNKIVIFFNFGVTGATAGLQTYYVDDVVFGTFTSQKMAMEKDEISFFPNPASGSVHLKTYVREDESYAIQIVDPLGRLALEQNGKGNKIDKDILLNDLKSGIYQVRIISRDQILQKRLVVQ